MQKEGWRSRGYLPHFDVPGLVQVLTFRLDDALPAAVVERLRRDAESLPETRRDAEIRRLKERWLDASHGACSLRRPEIAEIVERTMLDTDGDECLLLAWTVMPNHVHAVVESADDIALSDLLRLWKGRTAREANLPSDDRDGSGFRSTTTGASVTRSTSPTQFVTSTTIRSGPVCAVGPRIGSSVRRVGLSRAEARAPRVTPRP